MDKRYRLELVGITYNQIESGVYALVLQQVGSTRRIPIIIGFPEAQAIECKLQEVDTPRPLTHDTLVASLNAFGISLIEVEIYKLPNGVFAANLIYTDGVTRKVVDSRSSDAVALAIRVGAPIYTSETVLNESGFYPDSLSEAKTSAPKTKSTPAFASLQSHTKSDFSSLSDAQLSEAMMKAAENENYEEAARIKAEIDSRNAKQKSS